MTISYQNYDVEQGTPRWLKAQLELHSARLEKDIQVSSELQYVFSPDLQFVFPVYPNNKHVIIVRGDDPPGEIYYQINSETMVPPSLSNITTGAYQKNYSVDFRTRRENNTYTTPGRAPAGIYRLFSQVVMSICPNAPVKKAIARVESDRREPTKAHDYRNRISTYIVGSDTQPESFWELFYGDIGLLFDETVKIIEAYDYETEKNSIRTGRTRWLQGRVDQLNARHMAFQNDIKISQESIVESVQSLHRCKSEIEILEIQKGNENEHEKGLDSVITLLKNGTYRRITYAANGDVIAFTRHIVLEGHSLAEYKITIKPNGNLKILAHTQIQTAMGGYMHPHITGDGVPCLGNIAVSLPQLITSGFLTESLIMIDRYLHSYNPQDAYRQLPDNGENYVCSSCDLTRSTAGGREGVRCDHCDVGFLCPDCVMSGRGLYCSEDCMWSVEGSCSVCDNSTYLNNLLSCANCSEQICTDCKVLNRPSGIAYCGLQCHTAAGHREDDLIESIGRPDRGTTMAAIDEQPINEAREVPDEVGRDMTVSTSVPTTFTNISSDSTS